MSMRRLLSRFFALDGTSADKDFHLPKLGESRPHGHFREFTAPRRLQRGGAAVPHRPGAGPGRVYGIIPAAGENIP